MAKHSLFSDLKITSIKEGCRQLADILGLDNPVTSDVLISALQSEEYARNLLTCRGVPAFMNTLLENPPNTFSAGNGQSKSNGALLKSVSEAIVKWGKTGFSVATSETVKKRLRACLTCPDLQRKEGKPKIYDFIGTVAVCGRCGCDVEKKARMNSERCPGPSLDNPEMNRWGQPY
ncbi:MAG: hypothetical protein AAFZ63_10120 [Bacteroidota bacterium]